MNIDKKLDEILADRIWFIEQELNSGQNVRDVLSNDKDELEDRIKQLIANEFEKIPLDYENSALDNTEIYVSEKLKELKK